YAGAARNNAVALRADADQVRAVAIIGSSRDRAEVTVGAADVGGDVQRAAGDGGRAAVAGNIMSVGGVAGVAGDQPAGGVGGQHIDPVIGRESRTAQGDEEQQGQDAQHQ